MIKDQSKFRQSKENFKNQGIHKFYKSQLSVESKSTRKRHENSNDNYENLTKKDINKKKKKICLS